jgi:hypothetical protein
MHPLAPNDVSKLSLEEVLKSLAENRAWNKRLRQETVTLVNARLSQTITLEEYAGSRRRFAEASAECRRREGILFQGLHQREGEQRAASASDEVSRRR